MRDRRITKRLVDTLKPSADDRFVWDDTLIGFGVRVQPTGAKSYVVKYRAGSGRGAPTRRVTLGRIGTLTPDEARALARKMLGAVAHGSDPAAVRAAERRASTFRELAEIFLVEHVEAKRKRTTAAHYRSLLERIVLPELGSRKAEQVTTSDLAKLHIKMRECGIGLTRQIACWKLWGACMPLPAGARFYRLGSIRPAASNSTPKRDASVS